jgi:CelD/BcsL family acetyltransferase involved in cellulose biosynthesis
VLSWWEAFCNTAGGTDAELYVVTARDGEGLLVGALPFYEEKPTGVGPRRLRLIGDMAFDRTWAMTEEPCALLKTGMETKILRAVSETLASSLRAGRWDMVVMRATYEGPESLQDAILESFGTFCLAKPELISGSTHAELPTCWKVYRKELSKSMRDNLGYYPRLLTRDGHDWSVRQIRDPKEIVEACDRLVALHQNRSASTRGVQHDCHIDGPKQIDFLHRMMTRLSAEGKAFIGELVVDERVVASQAFVEDGDQLMVYYSGYEEEWYKYSPIFVIDAVVFQEALERGVRLLNFLGSKRQWTLRWNASWTQSCYRIVIVPKRPLSVVRSGALVVPYVAKNVLQAKADKLSEKVRSLAKRRSAKPKS